MMMGYEEEVDSEGRNAKRKKALIGPGGQISRLGRSSGSSKHPVRRLTVTLINAKLFLATEMMRLPLAAILIQWFQSSFTYPGLA